MPAAAETTLKNAPIEAFQVQLLEQAFRAASAMPLNPHIKDRSRAQDSTVAACLKLKQPARALAFVDHIANWRKASGYADVAYYCATNGWAQHVQPLLDRAEQIVQSAENPETGQAWRVDRVRANLARTYLHLGRTQDAERLLDGITESELDQVYGAQIEHLDKSKFDEQLVKIDAAVAAGGFQETQIALSMCAKLYERFFADVDLRARAEAKIKSAWDKLPTMVRIDLLVMLAEAALDHQDPAAALTLVSELEELRKSTVWSLEHELPLIARSCELRFRAGDAQAARSGVESGMKLFASGSSDIPDLFQAGALRPLAETYARMGDRSAALTAYRLVVEVGAKNTNPRPRAEDLTATCLSMAVHGIEPADELKAKLASIMDGIVEQWASRGTH